MKVLIAGESWVTTSTHIKGVDQFTLSSYVVGVGPLRTALEGAGHHVTHLPAHEVPDHFPYPDDLGQFDVVVLSDIGANSILLPSAVFDRSERRPNRLSGLANWVEGGGGLLMIGGYLSFTGIEAKAAYRASPVEAVLPVTCEPTDDRVERPEGIQPRVVEPDHPIVDGLAATWPHLLGYNRVTLRDDATLLATIGDDPLVAVREHQSGRTAVFTSDCAPHWAPPTFSDEWPGYATLFDQLVRWLGNS
jgi:uncharacterized membrane protein